MRLTKKKEEVIFSFFFVLACVGIDFEIIIGSTLLLFICDLTICIVYKAPILADNES